MRTPRTDLGRGGRGRQSSLPAGGYLASEHSELGWLTSAGGEYSLVLRADGDLGLFWMGGYGTQLWSAGTAQTGWEKKGPFRLVLLREGVSRPAQCEGKTAIPAICAPNGEEEIFPVGSGMVNATKASLARKYRQIRFSPAGA